MNVKPLVISLLAADGNIPCYIEILAVVEGRGRYNTRMAQEEAKRYEFDIWDVPVFPEGYGTRRPQHAKAILWLYLLECSPNRAEMVSNKPVLPIALAARTCASFLPSGKQTSASNTSRVGTTHRLLLRRRQPQAQCRRRSPMRTRYVPGARSIAFKHRLGTRSLSKSLVSATHG